MTASSEPAAHKGRRVLTDPLAEDLWRPVRWSDQPKRRPNRWPVVEVAAIGILFVWNVAANVLVPEDAGLPLNLLFVALLVFVGRRAGLSWDLMGARRATVGKGLRVGAVVAVPAMFVVAIAAFVPATREFLADDRFIGVGQGMALYESLVRIPFGTSLAEEIAFRGVMLGLLLAWTSPLRASLLTAVLFGFWHILPALDALRTNVVGELAPGSAGTVSGVVGQVLVTGLAGLGFAWLRFRGNSIATPVIVHWAINGSAYFAGWLIVDNAWV